MAIAVNLLPRISHPSRTLLRSALIALGVAAPLVLGAAPGSAEPASVASQFAQIMSREQAAMHAVAASRIETLASDRRAAKAEADVTLASRSVAPETATPAPGPARLDAATLDAMPSATGDAEWQCLAQAVYFESRGEPLAGQVAVAEVVLNRVDSTAYPRTICGVTFQGVGSGRACQFSYACDGRADVMSSGAARARAGKIARMLLDGRPRDVTDGATHFHATYVRPGWSRKLARTAAIGNHLFYRQGTRLAQD